MKLITKEVFVKRITFLLLICVFLVGIVYGQGIREEQGAAVPQQNNERQRRNERPQSSDTQRRNERQQNNEAQRSNNQRQNEPQRNFNTVTVEGTLKLERGLVAVESGETVYLVPMLNRYIGFINDLKEGANVSVAGYEFRNVIQPTKLTIGGRDYDFPAFNQGPNFGNSNNNQRRENTAPDRGNLGTQRNNPGNNRFDNRQDNFQPRRNNFTPDRRNGPAARDCCK